MELPKQQSKIRQLWKNWKKNLKKILKKKYSCKREAIAHRGLKVKSPNTAKNMATNPPIIPSAFARKRTHQGNL